MKYKIVELNEVDLKKFDGKIIQVIDSRKEQVEIDRNYFGFPINKYDWVLTCLVEIKQ